ncbi:MAG: hypothetical protein M0P31_13610 [Solirubrobacteraceae bacterium]|nr:hypothetical protein [Solirubrobacteraceae bacterium]
MPRDPLMALAVLYHRAAEHHLMVTLDRQGARTLMLVTKTSRALRRLRYRMIWRETRVHDLTEHGLGQAAHLLDQDLAQDPPRHRFERGHG